jgi:hypothetical protein
VIAKDNEHAAQLSTASHHLLPVVESGDGRVRTVGQWQSSDGSSEFVLKATSTCTASSSVKCSLSGSYV